MLNYKKVTSVVIILLISSIFISNISPTSAATTPPETLKENATPISTDKKRVTPDFYWNPTKPYIEEKTTFTDDSMAGDSSLVQWFWQFEKANPSTGTGIKTSTEFIDEEGSREVIMEVKDNDGVWCTKTHTLQTKTVLPEWEESDPFN